MTEEQVYENIGRLYMEKTAEFNKEAANILSKFKALGEAAKKKGNSVLDRLMSVHIDKSFNEKLNPAKTKAKDDVANVYKDYLKKQSPKK